MSPAELTQLSKGRIPARIVLDEIDAYLREQDSEGPVPILAERAGVPEDTLYTWLIMRRVQSIEFNVVDRLFCVMDRYHLWTEKYEDYYYKVDLSWEKCQCPGCNTSYRPKTDTQKYCTPECRRVAWKIANGRRTKRLPVTNRDNTRYCRRGHRRTKENTSIRRTTGAKVCLTCRHLQRKAARARGASWTA